MRRRGPLYAWLAAYTISHAGNQLSNLAIPWFVLETTGSVARAGVTGFFGLLPIVLAAFLGGPLIERVGYKRVSVVADILSGLTVALIPLLHSTVGLSFWQLQVLVFLGAFLDAPGSTARTSMIPELSRAADVPLERANSAHQIAHQAAVLAGPLAGGVLVGLMGASNVLWVNAATFVISSLLTVWGISSELMPEPRPARGTHYLADLAEGIRFVREDRLLFTMILAITVTNFLSSPVPSVLLPAYAEQVLGDPAALGAILSALGAGSILGATLYGAVGHRLSRRWVYLLAWVVVAGPQLVLATFPPLPFMIGLAALIGVGSGPLNPMIHTLMQERLPAEMRARVFGMVQALAWMAMPLGPMIGGFAAEEVGVQSTYFVLAVAYALVVVVQFFLGPIRAMDRTPALEAGSPVTRE